MYSVDGRDTVVALQEMPQPSPTAPVPEIYVAEDKILLAFFVEGMPAEHVDAAAHELGVRMLGKPVALVTFLSPYVHYLGPPTAETFSSHPLSPRGLEPFGAFEIRDSSWLRQLRTESAAHPSHSSERFSRLLHFVFGFFDTTFECLAEGYTSFLRFGSVRDALRAALVEEHDPGRDLLRPT